MPGKRDRLACQRHAMGMTQEQLAVKLDVERSTIYRWESGEAAPRSDLQPKLALALGIAPAELANLLVTHNDPSHVPGTTRSRHSPARRTIVAARAEQVGGDDRFRTRPRLPGSYRYRRQPARLPSRHRG